MAQVKFVRGNKITKESSWNSKVTADSIAFDKDNKEIYLGSDKYSQTKLTELTNDNAALLVGDSLNVAFSKLNNIIEDNEEVTAEALNDLNDRKVNTEDLATVATTGSYNDLTDKPDTLTFDSTPTENSTNPVTSGGLYTVITKNEKTTAAALNDLNDRKVNTTDLATVAISGNYNHLTNKPTIPTIPNLSKGTTTGSGNAVTDITVNGHTIKLTKGTTFANVASPTFTGIPKAPTAATGTNTTQIATTEFVQLELSNFDDEIFVPVSTLPTTNIKTNKIYIVPNSLAAPENNLYDEYIYKNNAWELIGTSQINLNSKLDKLVSGTNIKTVNNNSLLGSGNVSIATPGTLNTNNTTAQTVNSSEALSGAINLHKISKTGSYNDLIGKPDLTQYDEVVEGAYLEGHGFTTYSYNQTTGYSYVVNPVTYTGKTGTLYVDTITNTIYRYDGSKYVLLYIFSGNSTSRPLDNLIVGQSYFDTTLGLPIWWNGTAWVDALGNTPGSKNYVYVENN